MTIVIYSSHQVLTSFKTVLLDCIMIAVIACIKKNCENWSNFLCPFSIEDGRKKEHFGTFSFISIFLINLFILIEG